MLLVSGVQQSPSTNMWLVYTQSGMLNNMNIAIFQFIEASN